MGEVYRARDTKLGRDVAIKILPEAFRGRSRIGSRGSNAKRTSRVAESSAHRGIYGLEDADGVPALVMELVEGETLAQRIARGPIPLTTRCRLRADRRGTRGGARAGHRPPRSETRQHQGRSDGIVKVLDFGLAKAAAATPRRCLAVADDHDAGGTRAGMILGTAAYMSPEQARGKPVDKRADIWAFGVVLYEMLTGRRAFDGETISDVLAKVIEREPDWTALPASTPPGLRELLRRCARKDAKTRLQAIGDARVQIEELIISGATEETATPVATQPRARRARFAWIVAALSLVITAALAVPATLYLRRAVPEPLPTRFEIPTPPTSDPVSFALSADGRQLAFVATAEGAPRLWVRPLDQVTAQPLAGTEGASYPFWAPDGRAIGFFADGKLKRIDLGSGGPQVSGRRAEWPRRYVEPRRRHRVRPDGRRRGRSPLMRVMATGGTPVAVTRLAPGQGSHRWPQFLPDGRHFLFFMAYGRPDTQGVYVGTLDGGEPTRVLAAETAAVYAPPGALLWVRQGVLVAQRFDPARGVVSGEPIPVAQAVGVGRWRVAGRVCGVGDRRARASGRRGRTAATRLGRSRRHRAGHRGAAR